MHPIPVVWDEVAPSYGECLLTAEIRNNRLRRKLLEVIEAGPEFRVLVLGGSETAGVNCDDGVSKLKSCSWPHRLWHWLRHRFPGTRVVLDNQASGGSTTSVSLPSLGIWLSESRPHLILADFIVNDAFEQQESTGGIRNNLLTVYEAFVRQVRAVSPTSKLVFVVSCTMGYCTAVRDVIELVSSVHGVGVVSYYDVAHCAAQLRLDPSLLSSYWGHAQVLFFHGQPFKTVDPSTEGSLPPMENEKQTSELSSIFNLVLPL
jgi:hypothetical protein